MEDDINCFYYDGTVGCGCCDNLICPHGFNENGICETCDPGDECPLHPKTEIIKPKLVINDGNKYKVQRQYSWVCLLK